MSFLEAIWARIQDEPVLVTTIIQYVITLLVAYNLPISQDQQVAILGLSGAILALIARKSVTPA